MLDRELRAVICMSRKMNFTVLLDDLAFFVDQHRGVEIPGLAQFLTFLA